MNGIGLWLLISIFAGFVNSCGVTTHNVVAHRALEWFLPGEYDQYIDVINRHQDAFQNGAAFPDWGYDCFLKPLYSSLQDASEEAHWPPFQMATADFIRDNYPQPWSQDAEKLIAFLFGIVAHDVADIIWHDLEYVEHTRQGFIQALSNSNYNNHNWGYDHDAHNEADVGGEFMAAYEIDLSFIEWDWAIPSADLAKIYQSMNFTQINSAVIDSCNAELYAEVQAITRLPSELIYPHFASEASFLVDQYQDWWMGGLNDMSIWTEWCWPSVINWIEHGSNNRTTTDICLVQSMYDPPVGASPFSEIRNRHTKAEIAARKHTRKVLQELIGELPKVEIINEGKITYFKLAERDQIQSNVIAKKQVESKRDLTCVNQEGTESSMEFFTLSPYSLLGYSLAHGDLNNDGYQDIVMGAPGFNVSTGRVYIHYGSGEPVTGHTSINVECTSCGVVTISPPEQKQGIRFGYNLKTLDLNLDGQLDLVVSAPSYNADLYYYTGIVYVYYGGSQQNYIQPDLTIYTAENYTNLGVHLHTLDVNGDGALDLIIGNPFACNFTTFNDSLVDLFEAGNIWILLASQEMKKSGILTQHDATTILGINNLDDFWAWHGFHTEIATVGAKRYLLASQTMYNNGTMPIGKVVAYDVTNWKYGIHKTPEIAFDIVGVSNDAHLGYHFSHGRVFGKSAVALSFSTYKTQTTELEHPQAGSVFILTLEGLSGSYTMDDEEIKSRVISTIHGDEEFARFGAVVQFLDLDGDGMEDLFVTEPYRHTSDGGDAGAFYVWKSERIPRGEVSHPKESSTMCMHSKFKKSLYGLRGQALDFNQDKKGDVLIAGPRDQQYAMNGGTVALMMNVLSL